MIRTSILLATASSFAMALGAPASADAVFNRIASFPVNTNLPADADQASPTSAEIVTATQDGMTLIYSDSPGKSVGFVDIADPKNPKAAGMVRLEGEPTSVAVAGQKVLVALNTSKSKVDPSGALLTMDVAGKAIDKSCDLGGQPDSVAISPDGSIAAVAIENERDEEVNDGEIPQLPAGYVAIFKLKDGSADCDSRIQG